jgi:integrase
LVTLALLTGLRRSELVGLRWRDLALSSGRVSVRGKGGKLATIGLPSQAQEAIRRWQLRLQDLQGRLPRPDDPVLPTGRAHGGLLHSERGYTFLFHQPLSKWAARAIVARRAEQAGLGVVATHDLRRSFAGFLDEDGQSLQGIQLALRHSSPTVTARCYLDPPPRRAAEAVRDLEL